MSTLFEFRRIAWTALFLCCMVVTAWPHASLTATEPADNAIVSVAPAILRLSFSEPVSPTTIRLTKPDGTSVLLEGAVLRDRTLDIPAPDGLETGTHILSWRVVSEDGHPVGGSVIFSVGQPSTTPMVSVDTVDRPVAIGLWISKLGLYLGLFFGVGGVFAIYWLADGSGRGIRPVRAALFCGCFGTLGAAAFQGLDTVGITVAHVFEPAPWAAGFATSFGRTVALMMTALILSAAALLIARTNWGRILSFGALIIGSLALAASGHASAAEPQWLSRPAVFLHVLTIALWIGALLPLAAHLRANDKAAPVALRRFSAWIPFAVLVLAAAGLTLAVIQVREPEALLSTAYGNVLLVKLGLLFLLFLLAAFNRWKLTAAIESEVSGAGRLLARMIVLETIVVVFVFAAVTTWRFTPPPRALQAAAAEPASTHIHTDKAMVDLTVTPGHTGLVSASAILMTGEFGILDAREVSLVFSNTISGIEPIRRKAKKDDKGAWIINDLTIPVPGRWTVRVDILIDDYTINQVDAELDIRP